MLHSLEISIFSFLDGNWQFEATNEASSIKDKLKNWVWVFFKKKLPGQQKYLSNGWQTHLSQTILPTIQLYSVSCLSSPFSPGTIKDSGVLSGSGGGMSNWAETANPKHWKLSLSLQK